MCAKIIIILLPKEDPHTIDTYIGVATHHATVCSERCVNYLYIAVL